MTTLEKLLSLSTKEIRERGLGLNFDVIDPEDGFRKDNTLWFGTCNVCKEAVSSSYHSKLWQHNIDLEVTYHASGQILSRKSIQVDHCPLGDIVIG